MRYNLESAEQIQSEGLGELAAVDCARKHDHTFEVKFLKSDGFLKRSILQNNTRDLIVFRNATKPSVTSGFTTVITTMLILLPTRMDCGLCICIRIVNVYLSAKLSRFSKFFKKSWLFCLELLYCSNLDVRCQWNWFSRCFHYVRSFVRLGEYDWTRHIHFLRFWSVQVSLETWNVSKNLFQQPNSWRRHSVVQSRKIQPLFTTNQFCF